MKIIAFVETLCQDVRYTIRSLRRNPGFTAAAILTLALGIGANTTIFSVVDAAVFRPLPYRNPEQLVDILEARRRGTPEENLYVGMTRAELADWRLQKPVFQSIEAYKNAKRMTFGLAGQAQSVLVGR